MGHSRELSEPLRGTGIGWHLCTKSSHEISSLLNIPLSRVSGNKKVEAIGNNSNSATKWLAIKLMEWGQRMLTRNLLQSQSLQTSKTHMAFRLAQEQSIQSSMEWVSIAEQLHPSHISQSPRQSVRCTSPSGNLMDESGFGSCQENGTCLAVIWQVWHIWRRGDYAVGLFFRSWAWPLSSSERNSECFSIPRDFRQSLICGNSSERTPSSLNMTVHQCTKQGP
ncbi:hypothetical protein ILYODFUR_031700 [Ilyodon furcidens]|uniref:Uncharacterized protein n=1 Tax=Ilyodon furcidens TaxID=33524 RepID=A0ABV0V7S2_9TELE